MAKNIKVSTPVGTAKWPFLNKPSTIFAPAYKVDLVLPAKEAKPIIDKIKAVQTDKAAGKNVKLAALPIETEFDNQGNKTGNVILKCKSTVREHFDPKPVIFDSRCNKIDVAIGGGTKMKIALELYCWEAASLGVGVILQPRAVKVIDLVEDTGSASAENCGASADSYGASADSYGFEEEDGYVADEKEQRKMAMVKLHHPRPGLAQVLCSAKRYQFLS